MGRHFRRTTATERLVDLPRRTRRAILIGWALAAVGAGLLSLGLPGLLSGGGWSVAGSEPERAAALSAEGFLGRGATTVTLVVRDDSAEPGSDAFDDRARTAIAEISADPDLAVSSRVGWADLTGDARSAFVSTDGRTVIEYLALSIDDGTARRELPAVQDRLVAEYAAKGQTVSLVGTSAFWGEVNARSAAGLVRAELITLPLLAIILVLIYGGVAAAVVSLAVAGSSIVFTSALLTVIASHVELSVFVENTATMLGLGIGVDYSLFVISRFKEELRAGADARTALLTTARTAGHTVLASGVTVLLALATLFFVPLNVIGSIALGGVLVVACSVFVTVVLLPLLLLALGSRIEWGRLRFLRPTTDRASNRWRTFARAVMSRPGRYLLASVAVLALLAAPALTLQTNTPDARIVPTGSPVREGYDLVAAGFGAGATTPVQVVVVADDLTDPVAAAALLDLRDRLAGLPGVQRTRSVLDTGDAVNPGDPAAVLRPEVLAGLPADLTTLTAHYLSTDRRVAVIEVVGSGPAAGADAESLLAAIRAVVAATASPALSEVLVGGETAESTDSNAVIVDHLPTVVVVMLIVVYLLLLVTFRSVVLPLKAILMNLLSLGATYGVLVLVFQEGWGNELLGAEQGPVQNFVPVLLLALLFSLSTDYEVFLLGRVREEYQRTGDNDASVAEGLTRTAPLISGAALLMVAVFGAFAFTAILPIKQLGLGMAVAIALDATLIRLVVVPASMRLLGHWNWWPGARMSGRRPMHQARPRAPLSPVPPVLPALPQVRPVPARIVARPAGPGPRHAHLKQRLPEPIESRV